MGIAERYLAEQKELDERYVKDITEIKERYVGQISSIEDRRNELERTVGANRKQIIDLTNALTSCRAENARAIDRLESKQIELENIKRSLKAML